MTNTTSLPWLATIAAVIRRPDLWPTALRAVRSHAPRHWWRSLPPLPVPDRDWMQFRLTTAYGTPGNDDKQPTGKAAVDADEVIEWLEWLRSWNSQDDGAS